MLPEAEAACVLDGHLVCFDAEGNRLLSFDPMDIVAYAVDAGRGEPQWIMGGPGLLQPAATMETKKRPPWRSLALRPTFR